MPTTKLLYSKDVPNYKKWVGQYYGDIQNMSEIPSDDFANYLQDENRMHAGEFNAAFAVKELYSYAVQVKRRRPWLYSNHHEPFSTMRSC